VAPWHVDDYRRSDLRAALPMGGVLMGLDPGTKTIGVALCDAGWRIASPGKTIIRGKFAQDKAQIAQIIAERAVKAWSSACRSTWTGRKARAASRAMARNLADLDLPILMWDERWSTTRRRTRDDRTGFEPRQAQGAHRSRRQRR
jgi:putative Holliday junction resolvase